MSQDFQRAGALLRPMSKMPHFVTVTGYLHLCVFHNSQVSSFALAAAVIAVSSLLLAALA